MGKTMPMRPLVRTLRAQAGGEGVAEEAMWRVRRVLTSHPLR